MTADLTQATVLSYERGFASSTSSQAHSKDTISESKLLQLHLPKPDNNPLLLCITLSSRNGEGTASDLKYLIPGVLLGAGEPLRAMRPATEGRVL